MVDHQKIFYQLKHWYALQARDLAWRKKPTPYGVWISEIMLQQTQVSTVVDYYKRWMKKFPSIKKLSTATKDEVLVLWQGLGYYKRAISIWETARLLVANHRGRIPNDLKALMELPGIGRYTASAILSFAFGMRQPMVEVNISRVLTRFFFKSIEEKLKGKNNSPSNVDFWELSNLILPATAAKAVLVNQALMELGATVCKLKDPVCLDCPLSDMCDAHAMKKQNQARIVTPKKNIEQVQSHLFLLSSFSKKNYFAVVRRDENMRQGGLWCFPTLEHVSFSTDEKTFSVFSKESGVGQRKKNFSSKKMRSVQEEILIWRKTKKNIMRFAKQGLKNDFAHAWHDEIIHSTFAPAFSFVHSYTRFRVRIFVWIENKTNSTSAFSGGGTQGDFDDTQAANAVSVFGATNIEKPGENAGNAGMPPSNAVSLLNNAVNLHRDTTKSPSKSQSNPPNPETTTANPQRVAPVGGTHYAFDGGPHTSSASTPPSTQRAKLTKEKKSKSEAVSNLQTTTPVALAKRVKWVDKKKLLQLAMPVHHQKARDYLLSIF